MVMVLVNNFGQFTSHLLIFLTVYFHQAYPQKESLINSLSLKILFLYGNLQIKFEDLSTFKGFQISLKPRLFCLLYFDLLSYCMTYTCVYVYMYSRPRLYVCVFTRICMYMYVHIHACTCRFILV